MANKPRTFKATLEPLRGNLGWIVADIPFDPAKVWTERRRLRVCGTVNGFAFRSSLFPYTGGGGYFLLVNKAMQKGAKAAPGSLVEIVMEPDLEERATSVPAELEAYLRKNKALRRFYDEFSDSAKNDIARTLAEPKSPEARRKRVEQMVERCLLTMEAEQDTPPILKAIFAREPLAKKGWELLTPTQRRGHLLGIFHYKTPESRQKRAQKAMDDALAAARKQQEKT